VLHEYVNPRLGQAVLTMHVVLMKLIVHICVHLLRSPTRAEAADLTFSFDFREDDLNSSEWLMIFSARLAV